MAVGLIHRVPESELGKVSGLQSRLMEEFPYAILDPLKGYQNFIGISILQLARLKGEFLMEEESGHQE